eukprot:CAMPEP_0114226100 /NCGR_PEP_ID=MMETSP0058-20121206/1051_1 /TAXON_ID=36894 /ORGANISM="Pyramimonas parkeae, CCMP726" /LENGTH=30 /DNA_ID= /DNA_START= /DNA_END= /DNA_ORIENTATION=
MAQNGDEARDAEMAQLNNLLSLHGVYSGFM